MEEVAAFVFASGGVVRPDELHDLFAQQPAVRAQLPLAALKRAVARDGAAHGLDWRDAHPHERGPVVAHTPTAAQRESDAFGAEARRVPHALAALEQLVRAQATRQLRSGALSDFYRAFPLESAFMKRRSGGVVAFVQQYDPTQRLLCWDDSGGLRVPEERADGGGEPVEGFGAAAQELAGRAHACWCKDALAAEPAPEPESGSKWTLEDARCWAERLPTPPSAAASGEKSRDELRLAACTSSAESDASDASARHARPPPLAADAAASLLAFPRVLWAVECAAGVLAQARAAPRLHPIAFLVIAFERKQRAREDQRAARRASRAAGALCPPPIASDRVSDPPSPATAREVMGAPELLLSAQTESEAPRELDFEDTLRVLARVNLALRQATSLPAPHPLVLRLVAWERRQQSRRAKRASARSQAVEAQVCRSMSVLLIPRATLELLASAALTPASAAEVIGTLVVD